MGCGNGLDDKDDKAVEESANGENCEPSSNILEECARELNDGRSEFQRIEEEVTKQEAEARWDRIREEFNQVRDEVKGILPLAKIEMEQQTVIPRSITESDKWDDYGLFSKREIESFVSGSSLYHANSSIIESILFKGQSDEIAGEVEKTEKGTYKMYIYLPPFEVLASMNKPLLEIEEKVAEQLLVTIFHEIGAHVFYPRMSEEQRVEWERICAESDKERRPEISPQAEIYRQQGLSHERLGEWIGYFELYGDNISKIDKSKYEFIKTLYSSLMEE